MNIDHIWHPMRPDGDKHGGVFDEVLTMLTSGFNSLGIPMPVAKGPAPLSECPLIVCGPMLGGLPRRKRRPPIVISDSAVVYNHEQIFADSPLLNDEYLKVLRRCEVWDYSVANIEAFSKMGIQSKHVPIGYVPEFETFTPLPEAEKDIDVIFVGGGNKRRYDILWDLRGAGLKVTHLSRCYRSARDSFYARAKIVLNIHAYGAAIFETVRVSYPLANGCLVVSEDGADREDEDRYREGVVFGKAKDLPKICVDLCADVDRRSELAARGQAMMRAMRFDETLRAAIR